MAKETKLYSTDSDRVPRKDSDTDTAKIKTLANVLSTIAGRGKKPVAFLGGSTGTGFAVQWMLEQITQQPEYRWIYFAVGVGVVLLYGAMDYAGVIIRFVQTLSDRLEKVARSMDRIGEELKTGFADGRERFERMELWQREHLKQHHNPKAKSPSKPKFSSLADRPKTETAVEPPSIDPLQ